MGVSARPAILKRENGKGGYVKPYFHTGMNDEADCLVKQYHYSHRPPASIQVVGSWHYGGGLFGDFGEIVAACYFSIPPTRWSEPVWELSRLVRRDDFKYSLSGLISLTVKHVRKLKQIDLLVSFADKTAGHHGGIYQACSWNFHTLRKARLDGFIINGVFTAARTCNHRYNTSGIKLVEILKEKGIECIPHYDTGKYLYWRSLDKYGEQKAERLGLQKQPYRKPNVIL